MSTVNVAVDCPAGTVSEGGIEAAGSLLTRVTHAPPTGAGLFSVSLAVDDCPPVTDVGFRTSEAGVGPTNELWKAYNFPSADPI